MSDGVVFPKDTKGKRSSTSPAKKIWSTAVEAVDPGLAEAINKEKNWRANYGRYVYKLTEASVRTPETTVEVAQRGLDAALGIFEFTRAGKISPLNQAMTEYEDVPKTGIVRGKGEESNLEEALSIPFHGDNYTKEDLVKLLTQKSEAGEMEPDVVSAISKLLEETSNIQDILQDTYFVLFGATSELCPLRKFLELGLNVVAIARPSPTKQARLIALAEAAPEGATLTIPILRDNVNEDELDNPSLLGGLAGIDIIKYAPEVKNWLLGLYPGKRLIIGSYIYLDGAKHVLASMAMDSIINEVIQTRPETGLMYLGSPATVYPIPEEAYHDSIQRRRNAPWWHSITPLKYLELEPVHLQVTNPNSISRSKNMYLYNGIIDLQGPNYCLAKMMQQWRAVYAREVTKCTVSFNMAPPCATKSVMHVKAAARALRGMRALPPLTYYEPETAQGLMALLAVYDFVSSESEANPQIPLRNPMDLFACHAVHGGQWRSPYSVQSTGLVSYFLGLFNIA